MTNRIIGVIAGLITFGLTTWVVEYVGHQIFPLPEDFNPQDMDAIKAYIETAPMGALLFPIIAHAIGSFDALIVAYLIGKWEKNSTVLIMGSVFTALGIINLMMIPHPTWFMITDTAVYLPFALIGMILARKLATLNQNKDL